MGKCWYKSEDVKIHNTHYIPLTFNTAAEILIYNIVQVSMAYVVLNILADMAAFTVYSIYFLLRYATLEKEIKWSQVTDRKTPLSNGQYS